MRSFQPIGRMVGSHCSRGSLIRTFKFKDEVKILDSPTTVLVRLAYVCAHDQEVRGSSKKKKFKMSDSLAVL